MHFKTVFIFIFSLSFRKTIAGKSMGPVGKIILNSVSDCSDKLETNDLILTTNLKTIDDKGTKALNGDFTLKIPVDNSIQITLTVRKSEGSGWKELYKYHGKFCDTMTKNFPKTWDNLIKALSPAVTVPCPIKAGHYSLNNFQINTKDLGLPAIFYGRLQLKATLHKGNKMIGCKMGEGDSQAPF